MVARAIKGAKKGYQGTGAIYMSSLTRSPLAVLGSRGSTWSTPEQRLADGWPAPAPEPAALVVLEPEQPSEWLATVSAAPVHAGEQAGLYAYASALSWCKLVLEGAGGGAMGGVPTAHATRRSRCIWAVCGPSANHRRVARGVDALRAL